MGWRPESGFIEAPWKRHNELGILSLLAIATPEKGLPASSRKTPCERPALTYGGYTYINGAPT